MKRLTFFLLCVIIALTNTPVFAEGLTKYYCDGRWHDYHFEPTYIQVNGERLETDVPPMIFSDRSVVPARAVFEKLGANVTWNSDTQQVGISMNDTNIILAINDRIAVVNDERYEMDIPAKIINGRTMIPARFVGETLGADVDWIGQQRLITIDYQPEEEKQQDITIHDVDIKKGKTGLRIVIESDSEIGEYSSLQLSEHPRLVVDIKNAVLDIKQNEFEINDNKVLQIRASQYEINPNVTRFVVDLEEWIGYHISLSEDKKQLYIDFQSELSNVTDVKFSKSDDMNTVDITMDFIQRPNIFRLSSPDRIVVDFQSSRLGISEKLDKINANIVKSIRYGQFDENTTRIVIDVGGQPQFEVKEASGKISIELKAPTYRNMYYKNNEKPQLIIYSSKVASNYTETVTGENQYTLSVPASDLDLGTGRLYINDNHFEYIDIVQNNQTATTDIVFKAKKPYGFLVTPQQDSSKTIIDVTKRMDQNTGNNGTNGSQQPQEDKYIDLVSLNPKAKNKIVVVDAGHGGRDPGAMYGGVNEKDLNLDISLRLYSMLKNAGVRVYMTRVEDTFVDLEDRAEYANMLGASLFVSVHNNAMVDPNYDGTMTLYYPSAYNSAHGISSRTLAKILHVEMVQHLGTSDKGLRSRPELAVLRKTKMPAVIAEIAFMTNRKDLENLKSDKFRQKAAEALYVGIIKALNESVE